MYSFALYSCTFFHITVNSNPGATPFTVPNTPPTMGVASNTSFLPTLRLCSAHNDPVRWASSLYRASRCSAPWSRASVGEAYDCPCGTKYPLILALKSHEFAGAVVLEGALLASVCAGSRL